MADTDRVDEVARHLTSMAGLPYLGEPVDQRAHALQAAGLALAAGADQELVIATLLHDVARVTGRPGVPHAEAGAAWCAPRFGPRIAWLVGSHVTAKRFLVAADPTYELSPTSVTSLSRQGGPLPADAAEDFTRHPWSADAVRLRRWDDAAKVPGGPEAAVEDVLALIADLVWQ